MKTDNSYTGQYLKKYLNHDLWYNSHIFNIFMITLL
jgi:hypothetical protein